MESTGKETPAMESSKTNLFLNFSLNSSSGAECVVKDYRADNTHLQKIPMIRINWIRTFISPSVFAAVVILNAIFPARLHRLLPKLWHIPNTTSVQTTTDVFRPRSVLAAFQFGRIFERLKILQNASRSGVQQNQEQTLEKEVQALLLQTLPLVYGELSSSHLKNLEAHLEVLDARQSLLKRIGRAISLVNAIWFISIIGLLVTVYPTITFLGGEVIRIAARWFVHNIVPVIIRTHKYGVFEVLSCFICVLFIAQATRYLFAMGPGSPGSYVSLTAVCLAILAFLYTLYLHVLRNIPTYAEYPEKEPIWRVVNHAGKILLLLVLAPLAIMHKSELLGFGAVWTLMSYLGLFIGVIPHGYVAGFDTKRDMDRVALSSLFLVVIFVVGRFAWFRGPRALDPFHLGVMVLGNCGYFLALLIRSSPFFERGSSIAHIEMIVSLLLAVAAGRIFGIESMNSTASTYAVLYVMAQLAHLPFRDWQTVGWFVAFCFLYAIAVFLRTNPKYLTNLVDSQGLLRA